MWLHSLFPNPETLLALEPEELAGVVLEYLNAERNPSNLVSPTSIAVHESIEGYPQQHRRRIMEAVAEALTWLVREGLIARDPEQTGDWHFITRRGKSMRKAADVTAYRDSAILPAKLLHPVIASRVQAAFVRGEYDVAVFQAFREVEVAVRSAGAYGAEALGVPMIRDAFAPGKGPLAETTLPRSEQESEMHLFAAAIGLFKNPHSHRSGVTHEPAEAVELLLFASHLLRRLDRAKTRRGQTAG